MYRINYNYDFNIIYCFKKYFIEFNVKNFVKKIILWLYGNSTMLLEISSVRGY